MAADLAVLARSVGVQLGPVQINQLKLYESLVLAWTNRVRLVSRGDASLFRERHIADCLSVVPHLPLKASRVIDLGSGAGLPGIPVQIARPDLHVTLVESARMKALFLEEARVRLACPNLRVSRARAEQLATHSEFAEQADVVLARAVATIPRLWSLSAPLLRCGGWLVAFKGPGEVVSEGEPGSAAGPAREILAGRPFGASPRAFVIVEKVAG